MTKNNKNSFVISFENTYNAATAEFYRNRYLDKARELGLTVAGEDYPRVRRGVLHASKGNAMTIGTAKNHDVEWIERLAFAAERGLSPIFDGVKDYHEAVGKMVKYAEEKYGMRLSSGARVTFHKGFVKIGHTIIPNNELRTIVIMTRV